MTLAKSPPLTLEDFLKLPEVKPRNEYIDGHVIPKPMPKSRHSRLQGKLINAINEVSEPEQMAYAFPELRCTFGERSIVPDIAVFFWQRIVLGENGEPLDDVWIAPDWVIEILSPDQSSNRVTGNILHCLRHGCRLGWLIDPEDYSVMVFQPDRLPDLLRDDQRLVVLENVPLRLTAEEMFNWLQMRT